MVYTPHMKELIKKIESTRSKRIEESKAGKHFPRLSHSEGEELCHKFHPDYRKGTKREVRIGPNNGDLAPNELADILEAKSIIDPKEIDLSNRAGIVMRYE